MRTRLNERDLSRIVRRVINEQGTGSPKQCTEGELSLIPRIIKSGDNISAIFNQLASDVVTVTSTEAELNCWCRKGDFISALS